MGYTLPLGYETSAKPVPNNFSVVELQARSCIKKKKNLKRKKKIVSSQISQSGEPKKYYNKIANYGSLIRFFFQKYPERSACLGR